MMLCLIVSAFLDTPFAAAKVLKELEREKCLPSDSSKDLGKEVLFFNHCTVSLPRACTFYDMPHVSAPLFHLSHFRPFCNPSIFQSTTACICSRLTAWLQPQEVIQIGVASRHSHFLQRILTQLRRTLILFPSKWFAVFGLSLRSSPTLCWLYLTQLYLNCHSALFCCCLSVCSFFFCCISVFTMCRLQRDFLLDITNLETHKGYKLSFRGNNSVQDVKSSIADLTNIPVRDQQWEGWPVCAQNDTMMLESCGLHEPSHNLSVSRKPDVSGSHNRRTEDVQMVSEEESDFDEVHFGMDETESEIFGGEAVTQRKFRPMMPVDVENEVDALMHFMAEFSSRYGEQHPVFFIGSLEDACQEAFYCPAQDRKLLAVYLHHDSSILAHVFCSQLLCAESVIAFLSQSCISWAWDVTNESSRARLLSLCSRHFGSGAAQTLRAYSPEQFPLLLLISGKRNANEVISVTTGNTTLDELMMRLMHAMDIFTEQQQQDIHDEEERAARESMKREQDEAYRLSLEADRAKV
uniref:Fas (TNFRSF6) associated factor 1 n=1 Tax=Eptatretus burgeri TaxID=7764 RepID=A0A8C4Q796_EPTBU